MEPTLSREGRVGRATEENFEFDNEIVSVGSMTE